MIDRWRRAPDGARWWPRRTDLGGVFALGIDVHELGNSFYSEHIIRISIYAEECRIPIRIESRMPVLGITTLTLTGWSHSPRYPGALPCE